MIDPRSLAALEAVRVQLAEQNGETIEIAAADASPTETPRRRGRDVAPRKRRRLPTYVELVDNARRAMESRKSTILREPEECIRIWEGARIYKRTRTTDDGMPRETMNSSPLVGESVETQVVRMVEQTFGFEEWRASGGRDGARLFEELRLQLPQEFMHPWPGLCGAEREAIFNPPQPETEPETPRKKGEEHLRPGFSRQK